MVSVWKGISRSSPLKGTARSWPSTSTCGGRPTEKLRSEVAGWNWSIASRNAFNWKFFIRVSS